MTIPITMPKKVWGYGRGSTDKQIATCEVQHHQIEKWFHDQKAIGHLAEFEWGGWFEDKATTSKIPWFQRPGAQQMLINCQAGDMIVVSICDRAIRSTFDACVCMEELKTFGIGVKFLDNPMLDTTTIDGQFMFTVLSAMNQRARELSSKRIKERYAWARSQGRPINGKAPPGWMVGKDSAGLPEFVPCNESRNILEYVVRLYDEEGISFEKISWRLRKEGFQNKYKRPYNWRWIKDGYYAAKAGFPHPGERGKESA